MTTKNKPSPTRARSKAGETRDKTRVARPKKTPIKTADTTVKKTTTAPTLAKRPAKPSAPAKDLKPLYVHFRVDKTKVGLNAGKVYAVMLEAPDAITEQGPALPVRTLDTATADTPVLLSYVRLHTKHADEAQYSALRDRLAHQYPARRVVAYPKLTRQFVK